MPTILLIEDDITFSGMLEGFLNGKNFKVKIQHQGRDGLRAFREWQFDLVLLDYRLPDGTGLEVLQELKNHNSTIPVVIMTSFNDVRTAVKAIQGGATDYILKPVNPDELLITVRRALGQESPIENGTEEQFFEGETPVSKKLYEHVRLVAPTEMAVIVEGESGTGKERVARMIHQLSPRAGGPFIAVDCGSISKDLAASELFGHVKGSFTGAVADNIGKFEAANKGSLFLDEVGNLAYDTQVKLLRSIQEKVVYRVGSSKPSKIDVRIITATNDDLSKSVRQGNFREDLFHRLNEFSIRVPSLRDRSEDLIRFASLFRRQANKELNRKASDFSPEVIEVFKKYAWPGNLRELKNIVRRSVLFTIGPTVSIESLPVEMRTQQIAMDGGTPQAPRSYDLKVLQENQERELITKTLHEVGYNKSKAARILNIDRKTLYAKMEKYSID